MSNAGVVGDPKPRIVAVRDATAPRSVRRQYVRFAFYKVAQEWRKLPVEERKEQTSALSRLLEETAQRDGQVLRTFSLVGTRGDADFMVWMVSDEMEGLHEFAAAVNRLDIAGYLSMPYHYFSMTKKSRYVEGHEHPGGEGHSNRMVILPTGRKYLFVYPFVKTRAWYRLPREARQAQMTEHIAMGHRYPGVKINTTYSFGLDDQEFVVAFESDSVEDFLDLVQEMRESAASEHTVRDVPSFTCILGEPKDVLDALG